MTSKRAQALLAGPVDTRGWTSAMLVVRASSISRPVRVVVVPVVIEADGSVEPEAGEALGEIDVVTGEAQGEQLLTSALSTLLPTRVGVYVEAWAPEFGESGIDVCLVGCP